MQFEYAEDTVKRPDSICPSNIECNIQIWSHVRLLGEMTFGRMLPISFICPVEIAMER